MKKQQKTALKKSEFNKQNIHKTESISIHWYKDSKKLLFVGLILLATFITYIPALNSLKEFTNWDDPVYVTKQTQIKSLDWSNIKQMFNPSNHVSLNYHPVTMLSLAINHHFSKLNPTSYFLTNIIFHLLNTLLVFIFIYLLTKKKFWIALFSALFFGIHPMHVESVAWISERKDVLYAFFFLLSLISYIKYLDSKKIGLVFLCIIFFILSCLSKAMGVVLPLVLILIDLYYPRKFTWKTLVEKIPFFAVSIWAGMMAINIQSTEAIGKFEIFSLLQRFQFAAYGFLMYWVKLLFPVNLSAFYPYPNLNETGNIPLLHQISPIIALLIIAIPLIIFLKKDKTKFNIALFGIGFFIATIVLVLQFISVGKAIMADRYSYLPFIGAFFMIFSFANPFIEKQKTKSITIGIILLLALIFSVLSFNRVKVWTNSEKLWTDVIEKYPYKITQSGNVLRVEKVGVITAYINRANYYREHNQMDKAFDDYNILVLANTDEVKAYSNMGNFYGLKLQEALQKSDIPEANNMFNKSMEMYSKGLSLEKNNYEIYLNKGISLAIMNKHKEAVESFLISLKINPNQLELYKNLAISYLNLQLNDECIKYCNLYIKTKTDDSDIYFYRGTALLKNGKNQEAIIDYTKATSLNPKFSGAWYNLSVAQNNLGNYKDAFYSANEALKNGYNINKDYLNTLKQKADKQ
jgi:Tfp pilus assembly protein PilF